MSWLTRILIVVVPAVLIACIACLLVSERDQPAVPESASASAEATPTPVFPRAATIASAAQPPAPSASTGGAFRLSGGRVDAHLDMPLSTAVATLASAATIGLAGGEQLPDTAVRVDFDAVAVAEALLRLTVGYDSSFQYQGARLIQFSISPRPARPAAGAGQAAGESIESFDRLDPQQRGDAIESIALRGGARTREVVVHALSDPDNTVRLRALEQTQVVPGLGLPTDDLRKLLQQDTSENVRLKALDVLASDPGIDASLLASIAQGAQADSSEVVRSQAVALSHRLETANTDAPPPAVPEGDN